MSHINYIAQSDIFFSCKVKEYTGTENTVTDPTLVHVYSGSMTVTDINGTYNIQEGGTVLFYRSMVAKFTKCPSSTAEFKSVAIQFSRSFLQNYYSGYAAAANIKPVRETIQQDSHPLLVSLFNSILPYYDLGSNLLPEHLTTIKLNEAMTVLRAVDKRTDNILANFAVQGKIDLAEFMQNSFHFNIPLRRFAYLSGRSLATFKRDFQKTFDTNPQKWLLETRLKQAHYLIAEKNKKPSEVYLEVGFESFSHFSHSFKLYFGYTPSAVDVSCRE